jgi:putative ABC transport system permease protein
MGEALVITITGCLLGIALTYPVASFFTTKLAAYFPVFFVETSTIMLDFGAALIVGVIAAIIPIRQAVAIRIAEGLRRIG